MNFCRLIFSVLLLSVLPLSAMAETSIAVVDVQALLSQSEAAKSITAQVEAQKKKFLAEVSAEEQSLREEEKLLVAQRGDLPKEEFATKAKAFEERLYKMRQTTQGKKRSVDEAYSKGMGTLRAKVYEVVQKLAKEKGFNLVITKQNVIVGEASIDLTEETMSRLNKELPSIIVTIDQGSKDGAKER